MTWLAELRATALLGTGRHPVPPPPPELGLQSPGGLSPEELLLDQAALADVATRAARTPAPFADHEPAEAPPDDAPAASGEAARLLELLLTQPPVGAELRTRLVADWLRLAATSGRRVPHRLLPALFTLAGSQAAVRENLEPAIGTRGRWLQELQRPGPPEQSTGTGNGTGSGTSDGTGAGTGPGDAGLEGLKQLRGTDPGAAVERLQAAWDGCSARERAAILATLEPGLHPRDEPLLEKALDDKAKTVRDVAAGLLDRLPGSARAGRMAARLQPLLGVRGVVRKHLEIEMPPEPDGAARRDGIPAAPGSGEPDRLRRLDTIIRGAPLAVWTTTAGRDPAGTLALLDGEPRVIEAIRTTAVLRADPAWARALLALRPDARLLSCLPPEERGEWLVDQVRAGSIQPVALVPLLRDLPMPWGPALAGAVLELIARKDGGYLAAMLAPVLPAALPAAAAAECRRLLDRSDDDASRRRVLRDVVQYHSFRQSLTEAFR